MTAEAAPPSPAPSTREAFPSGFDALVRYNTENPAAVATTESKMQQQPMIDVIHAASQPASRYGTPAPALPQQQVQPYFDPSTMQYQDPTMAASQYPYPPETPSLYPMDGLPRMVSEVTTRTTVKVKAETENSEELGAYSGFTSISRARGPVPKQEELYVGGLEGTTNYYGCRAWVPKQEEPSVGEHGGTASYWSGCGKCAGRYANDDAKGQTTPAYNTPSQSPQHPDSLTLRSGPVTRSGGASSGNKALGVQAPGKVVKTPPRRKKEKTKAASKVAPIDKPLSELTADWEQPIVDIEAYVNRSAEVRRKEVEDGKIPGKIKRPMNAFMLYRKAYQNRTKVWCMHNNHQVVSQVCGESWPKEPEHLRNQFKEWAATERNNHQNAHPGYKFTPSKPKKNKNASESPEVDYSSASVPRNRQMPMRDDDSDLPVYGWDDGSRMTSRTHTPVDDSDGEWRPSGSLRQQYASHKMAAPQYHPHHHQVRSTFAFHNPGKPLPTPYNTADLGAGEYYQQSMMVSSGGHGYVEDISMHKTPSPSMGGSALYHSPQHPNNVALDLLHSNMYQMPPAPRSVVMHPVQDHHGLAMQQQAYLQQGQQHPQQAQHQQQQQAQADLLDPAMFGQSPAGAAGASWPPVLGSEEAAAAGMVAAATGGDAFVGFDGAVMEQQNAMLKGTESDWKVDELDPSMLDGDSWLDVAGTVMGA